jgi:hypothetical protein
MAEKVTLKELTQIEPRLKRPGPSKKNMGGSWLNLE